MGHGQREGVSPDSPTLASNSRLTPWPFSSGPEAEMIGSMHHGEPDATWARGTQPARDSTFLRAAAVMLVLAAIVLLVVTGMAGLSGTILFIAPALAAWLVWHRSRLVALYLAQMAIYFGLTSIVLGVDRPPQLVAIVVIWALGAAAGAFIGGDSEAARPDKKRDPPRWPHFAVTAGLIAVQAILILSGQVGYGAQLTLGLSTPEGLPGILATAAPVVSIMLLNTALGSQRMVLGAALFTLLEATVLALSGFRGTAVFFLLALIAAGALTLPRSSPWLRPRRVIAVASMLTLVAVGSFVVGANVRNVAATQLGVSSEGTQLFSLDQALPVITTRLDLGAPLQTAIQFQDSISVQEAVSWTLQLQALIPRFIWPDKPVVDYGQRVSVAVYGYRYGQTSSTISTIGDTLVNFKIPGMISIAVLLGFVLRLAEMRIRSSVGIASIVLAAALSYAVVGSQESPLILAVADVIRNLLVAAVLWTASNAIYRWTASRAS